MHLGLTARARLEPIERAHRGEECPNDREGDEYGDAAPVSRKREKRGATDAGDQRGEDRGPGEGFGDSERLHRYSEGEYEGSEGGRVKCNGVAEILDDANEARGRRGGGVDLTH